jgi:hypothetical protein
MAETIDVGQMRANGEMFTVQYRGGGHDFAVTLDGQVVNESSWAALEAKLKALTKQPPVAVDNIRIARITERGGKVLRGVITKLHRSTQNPMVLWENGQSEQIAYGLNQMLDSEKLTDTAAVRIAEIAREREELRAEWDAILTDAAFDPKRLWPAAAIARERKRLERA